MSFFRFLGARGKPSHPHSCLFLVLNFSLRKTYPLGGVGENKKRNIRLFFAVKTFYFWLSKLANLEAKNDLNGNPEMSEHFSEMRRAEEKISLFSGSTAENVQSQ